MKMKIEDIKPNPDNPRTIKDDNFKKLVTSIKEFPEMLEAREIILNKEHIILGGNMRYRAAKEAGIKELPVKIVDWSEEKQKEFIIKDNVSGGDWDWDLLANEWEPRTLDEWGLELPSSWETSDNVVNNEIAKDEKELFALAVVAYEDINDLDNITSFYELESIEMTEKIKEELVKQRKVYVFKK